MGLEIRPVPVPCTTHAGPAPTAERQERSGTTAVVQGPLLGISIPQPWLSQEECSALPATIPQAQGQRAPRLLPCCMTEEYVHPRRIHLQQHPPSSSPSTTSLRAKALPSMEPACGAPVPTWLLFSIPPAALHGPTLCRASAIPPGDGGLGLCGTAAVPLSRETASINRRHVHPLLTRGWPFPGWA